MYWPTGEKNEMEESSVVEIKTTPCYSSMNFLHIALKKLFERLKRCGRISIKMKIKDGSGSCCFPVIVSRFCDISEGKRVLTVEHRLFLRKRCVFCLDCLEYLNGFQMTRRRTVQDTKSARKLFRNCMDQIISTESTK